MWFARFANRSTPQLVAPARRVGRPPVMEGLEGRTLWSASPLDAIPVAVAAATPVVTTPVVATPVVDPAATAKTAVGPKVLSSTPATGATGVALDAAITAEVSIPNGGIDASTLTAKTVRLFRVKDNYGIPVALNTSGGGDVIVLKPRSALEPNTQYKFVVTAGLCDVTGAPFAETTRTFTTAAAAAGSSLPAVDFDQIPLDKTAGREYYGLVVGPDHQLYAGTNDGLIVRFPIEADGTVGDPTVINTVAANNGGPRFVVGLAFDPKSTPDNLTLWVTHTATSSIDVGGAIGADWTGKVSRLSGPDLSVYHDAVTHLPRSVRDHLTNQPAFGPDGAIYFSQPSNSAMGAPDAGWGDRPERLLSASILRLDLAKLGESTLDAHTEDADPYDPYAAGAPLTIYASGLRNSFDLTWHTDGHLYGAANGSAAGGATPAGPGGVPAAIPVVPEAETDYLFRIDQGKYYGHPNPLQKHYVLNGGNPTAGVDPYEVASYPVGTMPDPKWQPAVLDLGPHQAPVGMVQYHGSAFGGALDGKLLIARYSGGDDVVAVDVGAAGKGAKQYSRLGGLTSLDNPADLVEDPATGFLYVAELGTKTIRLLRPAGFVAPLPPPVSADPGTGGGTGSQSPLDGPPAQAEPIAYETRTRKERSLMKQVVAYAQGHSLAVPDVSVVPGAELKALLASLKAEAKRLKQLAKVEATAAKKNYVLPEGVEAMTYEELKGVASQVKHAPKA